jgi:hypothetical protein
MFSGGMPSITAPGPVEVSSVTFRNVYVYSPLKLWLAYGLALFFATGAVITGFVLMYKNQVSYSNSFSTILRTTRNAQINANFRNTTTAAWIRSRRISPIRS